LIKVEDGLMTGDVMFHEFIKKPDEKVGKKRKQTDDKQDYKDEEIKAEETKEEKNTVKKKKKCRKVKPTN